MKTKARFASNKVKLAQLLGISRQWLYEFAKLPDSPTPRADGSHCVDKWRRFLAKKSSKVQGGTEKERIQVALLQMRLQREELEYKELDGSIRESITKEIFGEACQVLDALQGAVERMPYRLAARFAGMSPTPLFKLFRSELDGCFQKASDGLEKIKASSRRKTTERKKEANVTAFNRAGAN